MIRRTALLVLVVGALVVGGGLRALAGDAPVQIRNIQAEGFPTIGVTVSVSSDVTPDQIAIDENGSATRILSVRPLLASGGTIDVVLAIDTSKSVTARLAQAVDAAKRLVEELPAQVPVGVVTFSDRPRVAQAITADHGAVLAALDSITTTQPGTALFDAVGTAAGMFSGSAQHNLVLLTDGTDTSSSLDAAGAEAAAQRSSATIFSIGLEGSRQTFGALQDLSAATHGTFAQANATALADLYSQLGSRLSHQYLVQYRSGSGPGAQVTITARVPGGSDTSVALIPRAPVLPDSGSHRPLLEGWWGLLVVLGLSFGAMFMAGWFLLGGRARAIRDVELARRMRAWSSPGGAVPDRPDAGVTAWIPDPLVQMGSAVAEVGGFKSSLDVKLERAGLAITPGEVVAGMTLLGIVGLAAGAFAFGNFFFGVLTGLVLAAIPYLMINRKMNRRVNLLHAQLPDVLMILASSIRAGHSFLQALDTVSKEIGDPSAPEFARVVTEIRLGRPFDQALTALAERVGTSEFKWAMLGVNVQREVGGNLAEILDTLAETVREREQVRRQVKVLSAEGRMSVKILIAMPFLITLYLVWVNPTYMRLLWTTHLGIAMLVGGLVLMVIGYVWSRKVVKFDV